MTVSTVAGGSGEDCSLEPQGDDPLEHKFTCGQAGNTIRISPLFSEPTSLDIEELEVYGVMI